MLAITRTHSLVACSAAFAADRCHSSSLPSDPGIRIGHKNTSDACESDEFAALLGLVERRIVDLADRIIAGQIDVSPYRINAMSPCVHCDFRSVCRFDVGVNRYNHLAGMKREQVLERALEESQSSNPGRRRTK